MNDITRVLADWPYEPEHTVRMIFADDGRTVLQVRLPLGVEQYELEGRPDGECPFDSETVLDEFEQRLREYIGQHGDESGFEISHDDFVQIQNEGVLYYYRYLLLFQLNDFERVIRDTNHNLRSCELVEKFVKQPEDRISLLQYKPYIIRVNAVSQALLLLQKGKRTEAEAMVQAGIDRIRGMPELESPTFQFERIRSVNYLRSALKQVLEKDFDPADRMKQELQEALDSENYERAAELRDQIRNLTILDKQ
jgi:hypothetical protein